MPTMVGRGHLSLDPTSPGKEGKRSALCLHVLLFPWKTQLSVTQQRSTRENKYTCFEKTKCLIFNYKLIQPAVPGLGAHRAGVFQ